LCGKCVRICDEIVSRGALTFMNRGIETKIGTEFDGPLNCEFCGSCISVCPVGALLARPFKFKARFWALQKKSSVCGYCTRDSIMVNSVSVAVSAISLSIQTSV